MLVFFQGHQLVLADCTPLPNYIHFFGGRKFLSQLRGLWVLLREQPQVGNNDFWKKMTKPMSSDQALMTPRLGDTYLRCIELHSHTLIQLESCFTATGQTRVTVVGPPMAKQWLLLMFHCVGSHYSKCHAQGLKMLERVRSQPLTNDDLVASISLPPYTGD
ncbi:hypothetical protein H8959_003882 [Pygathrix nigripes]